MERHPFIFDGHNDILLRLHQKSLTVSDALEGAPDGQLDRPRMAAAGFGGGLFALFVPSHASEMMQPSFSMVNGHPYRSIQLSPVDREEAIAVVLSEIDAFRELERQGFLVGCTSTEQITRTMAQGDVAAVLHLEGAQAIDPEFKILELLHAKGLRSLGPVWSRPNDFGYGVPLAYPYRSDTGPGLTDLGKELVRQCNRLGIMLDVSHLNEKGFDDLAAISDAPVVATHSNAFAICSHARNLTDRQLSIIAESDGMVGLNFAVAFLRPNGQRRTPIGIDTMLWHLDYLMEKLGEDRVGFGSDFDGATISERIRDVTGLVKLRKAMRAHGYDEALMAKLCHGNWMRVLKKCWKEDELH